MSGKAEHPPLGLLSVFSIAAGGMISSGLFVLPALVYQQVGVWILLAYAIASLLMVPAMMGMAELSSAMPRAGGTYFYIGRSFGDLLGYFAGMTNWLTITLKGAFALMGMGVFLNLIVPTSGMMMAKMVAIGFVVIFTVFNLIGVKESAWVQNVMVLTMILILIFYVFSSVSAVKMVNLFWRPSGVKPADVLAIAGSVFVSFGGLTKVALVGHQVHNPGKTLPRAMFTAFLVVTSIYLLAIAATIGVLDQGELSGSYTPLSDAAGKVVGHWAKILLSVSAVFAFATTANAAILTAAQSPMAMAVDGLLPPLFARVHGRQQTPVLNILITSALMALIIVALDLYLLVKVASTVMIVLFMLVNLAVIVMRESRIVSYRPVYLSPFYPLLPLFGVVSGFFLVLEMGLGPLLICLGFFIILSTCYWLQKPRMRKDAAVFVFLRRLLGGDEQAIRAAQGGDSDEPLRRLLRRALVMDVARPLSEGKLLNFLAAAAALRLEQPAAEVGQHLQQRCSAANFIVGPGLAVSHLVLPQSSEEVLVVLRCRPAATLQGQAVSRVFFLLSTSSEQNLRLLAGLAKVLQQPSLAQRWAEIEHEEELRYLLLQYVQR